LSPERDRAPAAAAATVVTSPAGPALGSKAAGASTKVITLAAEIAALAKAESQMDGADRALIAARQALERTEARMGDVRRKLSAIPFINSVFAVASDAPASS
jgi:outer membrane murein-binding lipoprotein Lpp